jgi:hypothetical protein
MNCYVLAEPRILRSLSYISQPPEKIMSKFRVASTKLSLPYIASKVENFLIYIPVKFSFSI